MGFLTNLFKALLPTALSWLAKNASRLVSDAISSYKNRRDEKKAIEKKNKLSNLEKQLKLAIEKKDEKEIIKLHIAISSIK